jgi:hypothetical protein
VRELLTRERKALDEVAERLLEKEVIEGDELVEILEEHAPNRGRKKGRGRTPGGIARLIIDEVHTGGSSAAPLDLEYIELYEMLKP